jgi:hypothetical protein
MRALPPALAAQLAPGAAGQLAFCWILTRRDGMTLGFTDHDRPLRLNGVTCQAASGFTAGHADAELGPRPGTAEVRGVLDAQSLTEADIAAGLYDRAVVEAYRVDWTDPSVFVLLWRGTIVALTREGSAVEAKIGGPLQALEIVVGRTYQRACDAELGDARCKVDVTKPPHLGAACDKSWRTCRDTFANLFNFQGFPDIPGDDYLAAYASDSPANTGGSRRT